MNKKNLIKMADYIETIPQEMFDMYNFRSLTSSHISPECESVGCIIGHCTVLDTRPLPRSFSRVICFLEWSSDFTGLNIQSGEWEYLFGYRWKKVDNTPQGAADRIRYVVQCGLPSDWIDQMNGFSPLSYQ